MCKSSNRKYRLMIMEQERQAAAARAQAAQAQAEQRALQEQAIALQQQQLEFQRQQQAYVEEHNKKLEELANRPPPPPPAPSAPTVITGGTAGMVSGDTQSAVDSRKKGRAALRIDLNAPQTAGATGLNVPRG